MWYPVCREWALDRFAQGMKIKCEYKKITQVFDWTRNKAHIFLTVDMIKYGEWFVKYD